MKVGCLMFFSSLSIAQAFPASYLSEENPVSSEMDESVDSFLDNLEYYKNHPEEALGDLKAWNEEQNQKERKKSEETIALKNEQVRVFFGGWMGFFTIVIVLYLLKFAFNIFRDSLRFLVKEMIEMKRFLPQLKTACGYVIKKFLPPDKTPLEDEEEEFKDIELQDSPSKTSKFEHK